MPQVQGTAKGKTAEAACLLQDPNDPLIVIVTGMGDFPKALSQTGSHIENPVFNFPLALHQKKNI